MAVTKATLKTVIDGIVHDLYAKTTADQVEYGSSSNIGAAVSALESTVATLPSTSDVNSAISAAIDELIDGAPSTYDTLKEIADYIAEHGDEYEALVELLNTKVDKVTGKGLSTEDFTSELLAKLNGIESGATNVTVDSALSGSSTNPVQNKVVKAALDNKVNVVSGKGLSTNDYTTEEKNKLGGIEAQANKTVVDSALSSSSTNPVQNKVIKAALDNISSGIRYITPQKFGAVGDGVTDDTTAVHDAVAYAKTNGIALFFPRGTYLIRNLEVWDDAVIYGEDMNTTVLVQSTNGTGTFVYTKWENNAPVAVNNATIRDITLDGYTNSGHITRGILYHGFRLYLERVTVRGFKSIGIHVTRPDTDYAGKHGYMKDLMLYDNAQGNMLYEGETDNNFYNIMAYHNAGIEPDFNVKFNSAGCRIFGMHLWGNADISLWNNCFGATYTGCHIEGGKTAKIAVQQRMQFNGEIYHHESNNTVTAIKALDSLYDCIFDFEARNIYTLFDFDNKWKANCHVNVVADMVSDNLFANGRFGVADDVVINWGYNNSRYVYIMNAKNYIDTYNNVNSTFAEINESYYNGTSKILQVEAGNGQTDDYISIIPGTGEATLSAKGNSNNVDLKLVPKGNGAVKFNHTCITGADYDDFVDAGFYEALGDTDHPTQNAPDGNNTNNNFLVLVQNRGNRVVQIASSVRTPVMYQRLIIAGVASDWERITTGAEYTVTPNSFTWNIEGYVSIEQAPKNDIHVKLARDRYTIGNSGEDLNNCVDTTKIYYNWNGISGDSRYPVNTPTEMQTSPFHMICYCTRTDVLVQKLEPDFMNNLGSVWYRRRTGAGTPESPYVWEPWTSSQNSVPMGRINHLGANYNDFKTAGMYLVQGTSEQPTQNSPDGNNANNNYVVFVGNPGNYTTYLTQTAYNVRSAATIYHRTCSNGTWGAWKRLLNEDDVQNIYVQSSQPENLRSGDLWVQIEENQNDIAALSALI